MECPYPKQINNPTNDLQARRLKPTITVDCNRCTICMKNRKNEWFFRLKWQQKYSEGSWVVNLDYNNNHVPFIEKTGVLTTDTRDVQLFIKKVRRAMDRYNAKQQDDTRIKEPVKYFALMEYGERIGRPHIHLLLFNVPENVIWKLPEYWSATSEKTGEKNQMGQVKFDELDDATIHYVTNYMFTKEHWKSDQLGRQRVRTIMSTRLGYRYVEKNAKMHTDSLKGYVTLDGVKYRMPQYFKRKIFGDDYTVLQEKWDQDIQEIRDARDRKIDPEEYRKRIAAKERILKRQMKR